MSSQVPLSFKQPDSHVFHYISQPLIANYTLSIDGRHRIVDMAHDRVYGHLIAAFPTDNFELPAERIETQPGSAVDVKRTQHFAECVGQRIQMKILFRDLS